MKIEKGKGKIAIVLIQTISLDLSNWSGISRHKDADTG
jgi:hypothetical protein